ncbi:CHAP domain-containing protein [Arthrobacter antibioticus]|uniref:CHAP domain-containing protein n=1 Tax=Arthrobacter sp. H35-MC1 TaxID=3046203 RepID=UPI0024B89292|nr:CHAP domain-containing protein [Arthrobacter sp. H35-MC1]MDJ0318614.1 CHAP domain-containing protein [Arthrobacter sp. H35-MC1]
MNEESGAGAVALLAGAFLLPVLLVVLIVLGMSTSSPAAAACLPGASVDTTKLPTTPVAGFEGEQLKNAALIINAGQKLNLSTQGQTVGVMVAIGESGLRVLDHGDGPGPDSRGLFQQRDNGAWGSYTERMDPTISATNFFKALLKVSRWESMTLTAAAHVVQGNADPDHYTKYAQPASAVIASLAGITVEEASCEGSPGIPGESGKDDDYGFKDGLYNANNPVTGFSYKNCTDFAWWRMMQQLNITDPSQMDARALGPGHAMTWGPTWQREGWTVTMTPKVGAIIWYGPGNPGGDPLYGHVAVVKAIAADGTVLEEGYNMGPDHLGGYYTRTIAASSPSGYLLIPTSDQFAQAS